MSLLRRCSLAASAFDKGPSSSSRSGSAALLPPSLRSAPSSHLIPSSPHSSTMASTTAPLSLAPRWHSPQWSVPSSASLLR